MAELWDAYDRHFHRIPGVSLIRGEKLPQDVFHLVSEILVMHADGTFLLMQRDHRKHYGGKWELTAGGSALQGETSLQCAYRELREETGIRAENLQELGRIVSPEHHTLYVEYRCVTDCPRESVVLQEGETIDYQWVTREQLESMLPESFASVRMLSFVQNESKGPADRQGGN